MTDVEKDEPEDLHIADDDEVPDSEEEITQSQQPIEDDR